MKVGFFKKWLCVSLTWLAASTCYADGPTAVRKLYANLAANQSDIGAKIIDVGVAPTLVRGVYAFSHRNGRFMGFTNEAGTLVGDFRGFHKLDPNGGGIKPLSTQENNDLRAEIAAHIDTTKIIAVKYGDGRLHTFMFSAIDCPACQGFEKALSASKSENSTYYVIPSSLRPIGNSAGNQQWQKVSAIWCAPDSGTAWRTYWATMAIPTVHACSFADPLIAERAQQQLWEIFKATGVPLSGVPSHLRMDGVKISKDIKVLNVEPTKDSLWLSGAPLEVNADFRPISVGG